MKVWPMFCKLCGRSIQREDNFCSGCGAPIAPEPFESAATSGNSTAGAVMSIAPAAAAVEMQKPLIHAQNQTSLPAAEPVRTESKSDPPQQQDEHIPPPSMQEEDITGSPDASPDLKREESVPPPPQATPTVRQFRRCPRCRRLNTGTDLSCDWCGTELPADTPAPAPDPAANIAPPSFAGYATNSLASEAEEENLTSKTTAPGLTSEMHRSTDGTRRKSRLPVLEILVIVLLLAGAGAAVWILRSSLPSKTTAATSSVVVTIAPESAHVVVGKAFDFSATVSGTDDTQVRWKVEEGDAGGRVVNRGAKAAGGTVSSLAVYIAPRTPGTYHLLATSKADPRESASAEVTVTKR